VRAPRFEFNCEFFRRQVAQRAVSARLVVIDPPVFDGLARIVQGQEPVLVQTFLSELAMDLCDHLKTGRELSIQNRPTGLAGDVIVLPCGNVLLRGVD